MTGLNHKLNVAAIAEEDLTLPGDAAAARGIGWRSRR